MEELDEKDVLYVLCLVAHLHPHTAVRNVNGKLCLTVSKRVAEIESHYMSGIKLYRLVTNDGIDYPWTALDMVALSLDSWAENREFVTDEF